MQALLQEFFRFILHRTREGTVTVAAKSGQFTAGEAGKGQFVRGNRRNLAKEKVVRYILSPRRIAGVPNLHNDRDRWAENIGKTKCCSNFGERICQFTTRKCSATGDPLEA